MGSARGATRAHLSSDQVGDLVRPDWSPGPEQIRQAWLTAAEGHPLPARWWRILGERLAERRQAA